MIYSTSNTLIETLLLSKCNDMHIVESVHSIPVQKPISSERVNIVLLQMSNCSAISCRAVFTASYTHGQSSALGLIPAQPLTGNKTVNVDKIKHIFFSIGTSNKISD